MATAKTGKQQAAAARKALRQIEKTGLKLEAQLKSSPHFADLALNAVTTMGDLAATIRKAGKK